MKHHIGQVDRTTQYAYRVSVYGIIFNDNDQVAITKLEDDYFLPGGGIEDQESHEDCLHREFLEETGYQIEIGDYIGHNTVCHYSKRYNKEYFLLGHYYFVTLIDKVTTPLEKGHSLLYMSIDDLKDTLTFAHQVEAIEYAYSLLQQSK